MATFVITADSTPVYDTWGWADYWSCEDWIAWHKALKVAIGKEAADLKWIDAWNAQSFDAHDYSWCKYSSNFSTYVNGEGLPVTHLLSDIITGATKAGGNVVNTVVSATGIPLNVANVLKWLIPTLVVIAAIVAIIWAYKKYAKN